MSFNSLPNQIYQKKKPKDRKSRSIQKLNHDDRIELNRKAYMKNEAVTMRPIASMKTDRVGYQASGTGLVIGFGAFKRNENFQKR